tara:strand:- start:1343 stop:1774 length:432 start_codon:yes stop_codon:yes gene_type:complete
MKFFNLISLVSFVGIFFISAQPSKSSVFVDLDAGMRVEFDDSEDYAVIKKGSENRIMRNTGAASRPIPAAMVRQIRSELRNRGVKSFSTGLKGNNVQRVGVSGDNKIYAFRGIDNILKDSLLKQFPHLDVFDVGHWTIYSLVQ